MARHDVIRIRGGGGVKQIGLGPCFALDAQAKRGLRLVHGVYRVRHLIPAPRLRFLPGRWHEASDHGLARHILIRRDGPPHLIGLHLVDQLRLIRRTVGPIASHPFTFGHPGLAGSVDGQVPGPRRHISFPKLIGQTDRGLEQKPQQGPVALDALIAPVRVSLLTFHQRRIHIQRIGLVPITA